MNQNYKAHIELINRQIKELVGLYRDAVKELNVAESEFWIWYTLVAIDGEHTQQDICSLWSLPKQTVNTIIARLRLKRYATLEAIPGTRNHKYIRLTEDGLAYGENLIGPILEAERSALEQISSEALAGVTSTLGNYIDIIRTELGGIERQEAPRPRLNRLIKRSKA